MADWQAKYQAEAGPFDKVQKGDQDTLEKWAKGQFHHYEDGFQH